MRIGGAIPSIGFAIRASDAGKMSLPVSQASYIYSHFKHVSGVPAPEGTKGVAITKLKILDVLIEQLGQMKKRPEPDLGGGAPSDKRVDALIKQYEGQIKAAQAVSNIIPYTPAPSLPTGILFSLTA
jgi:hypothetical protein